MATTIPIATAMLSSRFMEFSFCTGPDVPAAVQPSEDACVRKHRAQPRSSARRAADAVAPGRLRVARRGHSDCDRHLGGRAQRGEPHQAHGQRRRGRGGTSGAAGGRGRARTGARTGARNRAAGAGAACPRSPRSRGARPARAPLPGLVLPRPRPGDSGPARRPARRTAVVTLGKRPIGTVVVAVPRSSLIEATRQVGWLRATGCCSPIRGPRRRTPAPSASPTAATARPALPFRRASRSSPPAPRARSTTTFAIPG